VGRVLGWLVAAMLAQVAGCSGLGWTAATAGLWAIQETLLFPVPDRSRATLDGWATQWQVEVHEVRAADDTRLYAWHARGDGDRLVLYFHGNGGGISAAAWLRDQLPGWDVAAVAYRGYPGSEGAPTERGFARDARAAWRWATEELGFPPDRIVVHGRSLGGGVSAHLLAEARPAGVVWDSTFHSLQEVVAQQVPWAPTRLLLRHPFRTDLRLADIDSPVLLLHGTEDALIPLPHARANLAGLPNARLVEVAGQGHGHWLLDHPRALDAWRSFLEEVVPTAPRAPRATPTPPPTPPDRGA
jgi:pimeloyl-ACP methyl ester carboxylesterase